MNTKIERTPGTPPIIPAVADFIGRPTWSVMIPTYNSADHLQKAVQSVLDQGIGPEYMQIVVVDDASTDGDIQALVQRIGQNRVSYFRQVENVGSLRNFEACLKHSTGKWVHLLHADDWVEPGFYTEIESLFSRCPEAGAAFTNHANYVSHPHQTIEREPFQNEPGIVPNFLLRMAERQDLAPSAVVVKRSVYEELGGYFAVHYGEDWEMWARIGAHFPVAYSPKSLARYHYLNTASISRLSIQTGQNARDIAKVIDIIQHYLPLDQRAKAKQVALRNYSRYCASLAHTIYEHEEDYGAAFVQTKSALEMSLDRKVVYLAMKFYLKHAIGYKSLKKMFASL